MSDEKSKDAAMEDSIDSLLSKQNDAPDAMNIESDETRKANSLSISEAYIPSPDSLRDSPRRDNGTDVNDEVDSSTTSAADEAAHKENSKPAEDNKKSGTGFQKRISKLTAQKNELIRENVKYQKELAALRAKPIEKPLPTQFTDQVQYFEELGDYRAKKQELEKLAKRQDEVSKEAASLLIEAYKEKVTEFKKEHKDYDEVINSTSFSQNVQVAALNADSSAEIFYYLSNNPEELAEINDLNEFQAAYKIGRIEAKLHAPKIPQVKNVAKPITPVRGVAVQSKPVVEDNNMDFSALEKELAPKLSKVGKGW